MTSSVRATMPFTTSPSLCQSSVTTVSPSVATWRALRSRTDQRGRAQRPSTGNNQAKLHGEISCTERYRLGQPQQLMATANLPRTKTMTANLPLMIVGGSPMWHAYCCRTKPERHCITSLATTSAFASDMHPEKPNLLEPSFDCCSVRSTGGFGCRH